MNKFTVNGELYRIVSAAQLKADLTFNNPEFRGIKSHQYGNIPDTLYLRDSDGTLHLPSTSLFESRDLLVRPSELAPGDVVYDEHGLTYDIIELDGEIKAKVRYTNTSLPIWQLILFKPQEEDV